MLVSIPAGFSSTEPTQVNFIPTRNVPLTIKVVLVGFDPTTIDQSYLDWKGNEIQSSVNNLLDTGNITGVTYDLSYDFVYTSPEFEKALTNYLSSIQEEKLLYNPWFRAVTHNYLYDANKVQDWLAANNASFGGFPTHGDAFVFANLTSLPSITETQLNTEASLAATPHYYKTAYSDKDLGYTLQNRQFTVAWGGDSRLWFLDMAAGPEYWTWSSSDTAPHIPMQLALNLFELNIHTPAGKQWLTKFVSDYVSEAVQNLAVPVYTYQPVYSHTYRIVVNIIDNRTTRERNTVHIEDTYHPELVRAAFADLLPYAKIQLETKLISASDDPSLQAAIIQSTVIPPSDVGISPYVDLRPVYKYLQEHVSDFVGTDRRDSTEYTLPVFAFAFSSAIFFGYTIKWYVAQPDTYNGNFLGISLGDMSIIGLAEYGLEEGKHSQPPQAGKGVGFTQTVIHETGHSLGLIHPHQFGSLEDFEASPMSYWGLDYRFSQFDKDAVNRAHADQLILSTQSTLAMAQNDLDSKFNFGAGRNDITAAKALLDQAIDRYNSMKYVEAVEIADYASQTASNALTAASSSTNDVVAMAFVFLIIGIAVGSSLIFIAMRKYSREVSKGR
jgi:hypothetical protein